MICNHLEKLTLTCKLKLEYKTTDIGYIHCKGNLLVESSRVGEEKKLGSARAKGR